MISWDGAAADLCAQVGVEPGAVSFRGTSTGLGGPFPVDALAMGAVATAGLAAAQWRGTGAPVVDAARVGSSFRADQLAGGGFAAMSGFFRAADGWVRTHANYAHHRERLVRVLGGEDVGERIRTWSAREVEDAVTAAGGIAVAVRSRAEWADGAPGRAVAGEPLVRVRRRERAGRPTPERPRVLDLTRVIAGPVATRTLALLGADVLRVDPPGLPEIPAQHADTGIGKRTTVLDAGSVTVAGLLAEADVLVVGYRPGSLDAHRLDLETVRLWYPHLMVRLDAWGWTGPWAGRRGFDSIVQAACGIAERCGDGARPGALPAQALDHATGYLAAASAIVGLLERPSRGASVRDLSLARTAEWLWSAGPAREVAPVDPVLQDLGDARVPPPPLGTGSWGAPAHPLGSDAPTWLA